MPDPRGNERRYYDALKRITLYQSPDRMRRESEWGLAFEEALEYAYENIQSEARSAIKGRRRPPERKPPSPRTEEPSGKDEQVMG